MLDATLKTTKSKKPMKNNLQIVNINKETELCSVCGTNILDILNFTYEGESESQPQYIEELCKCKKCDTQFIMHYDLFDTAGHIYSRVFTEDINNPTYHWQDVLTEAQKTSISGHLKTCTECCDRLEQEILTDAWFKSVLNELRRTRKT